MNKIPLTTRDSVERGLKKTMTGGVMNLRAVSVHFWLILVSVEGWTYHSNDTPMTWNETREWCKKHYTDIVVVDTENVTSVLKEKLQLKTSTPYYWIGLKKINDSWIWIANSKIEKYKNWAANEPNNAQSDESCVELYISNTNNNGKWNDDGCKNKKYPVCHKAQCLNNSCSDKGLCKEQANNFTCECEPGFSGPRCESVVSCDQLSAPPHGWMKCSGLYGNNSLNSNCKFSCDGGYRLRGTAELKCNSLGAWNAPPPSCAVECFPLVLFGGGLMNCTKGHNSSRSACKVQCPPGQLLLGFAEFTCGADGTWVSSFPLMCASFVHFLIALLASVVISVFCGCFCSSICKKSNKAVRLRTQQETLNPAFEAEHSPLDGPLCSA